MDNVAIGMNKSPEGIKLHEDIVHKFLDILQQCFYFLKASKCKFKKNNIDFLGF